jgi:predicted anti-sigma-YlaC factor YlaD
MEHPTYLEKISQWLDNELPPAEVTELQTHLSQCSTCQETYLAVRRADTLLRRAATIMVEPTPGFTTRFDNRLASHRLRRPWQAWLALSVLLLGSFSLLTAGALIGGVALLNIWANLLNVQISYYLLGQLGQLVYQTRNLVTLITVLLQLGFTVVTHPLFWVSLPGAGALGWLWLRLMKTPYPSLPTTGNILA